MPQIDFSLHLQYIIVARRFILNRHMQLYLAGNYLTINVKLLHIRH